jgi:hypothetical protein
MLNVPNYFSAVAASSIDRALGLGLEKQAEQPGEDDIDRVDKDCYDQTDDDRDDRRLDELITLRPGNLLHLVPDLAYESADTLLHMARRGYEAGLMTNPQKELNADL